MRNITLLISMCMLFSAVGFGQCYWAKQIATTPQTGGNNPEVNGIITDTFGNVYTTGMLHNGNYDLDPGTGTQIVTSNGYIGYIQKLDKNGNFVFGKTFSGNGPTIGTGITIDQAGNIYISGYFLGTTDFDPGAGTSNLTASSYDGFVCKLDNNGNFIWAVKVGGSSVDYIYSIDLDQAGNILLGGYFQGTTDLDPSAATFNLTSNGSDDIFVLKLNNSGGFIWGKSVGGTGIDRCFSISCMNNSLALTGSFSGTVDFDPGIGIINLTGTGYLLKLDNNGNYIRAVTSAAGNAICTDNNNNLLLATAGSNIKLDSNLNTIWNTPIAGATSNNSISFDANGNVYSTGNSGQFIRIYKQDNLGNLLNSILIGDPTYGDDGSVITTDNLGNVIIGGFFSDTVDFDPGAGTYNLISSIVGTGRMKNIFTFKIYNNVTAPLISPSGPLSLCQGSNITLSSSYLNGNIWSNGATTSSIQVGTSGSYFTSVSDSICYSSSSAVSVTVNSAPAVPTITTSGPLSYCQGNTVSTVLTSSLALSYLWSTGETTRTITALSAGTYTVSVYNANGCSSSSIPVNVVVNPLPTAVASNPGPFCTGNFIQMNATGGNTYSWSGPGGFSSASPNPIRLNSTTAMAGIYTVTVTSTSNCTATASTTVTVNQTPVTPNITYNFTGIPCQGDTVILSSNYTSGNVWSNGATTQSINITNSGTYWVYYNNGNCNSIRDSINVTINPNSPSVTVSASGPLSFCQGDSVVLTSNRPHNNLYYNTWYNGTTYIGSGQSFTVRTPGTYFLKLEYTPSTGIYYCPSYSTPVTVTVLPQPSTPSITAGGPLTICSGNSVTLSSSSSTGNLWSNGATTSSITVSSSGNYSVRVNNGACNSLISNILTVTVVSSPTTPVISIIGSLNLCKGEMVTLSTNQTNGILWSNGETTQYVDIYDAGTYTVSVSNGVCPSISSGPVSISVNNPDIYITASRQLAENSPNTSITFTANTTNVGTNPIYQWYKNGLLVGSNSSSYTNSSWVNGEKIVCRVTSSNGCSVYSNDLFVWLANTTQNSWQRMADVGLDKNLTIPVFPTRIGAVSFVIGDKIYVGLGYNDNHGLPSMPNVGLLSDFWEYNTLTDEWTERAPFAFGNSPRTNAISFVVNGKGYVGFGQGSTAYFNDLWEYNPQTDTWVQKSNCPGAGRHSAVATSVGNSGYIGTGWGFNTYLNDWWKYTPATDSWIQLPNFPYSSYGYTCAAVNNKIYVTGSFGLSQINGGGITYEFNPDNNTWNQKAAIPSYRFYAESFVINDTIFVCGGQLNPSSLPGGADPCQSAVTTLNEVWAYYPSNDSWTRKGDMLLGKISNGCAASVNGYGYYIGGGYFQFCQGISGGYGREANLKYSPQTDSWEIKAVHGGQKNYFGFSATAGNKGYALFSFYGITGNSLTYPDLKEVYIYEYDPLNNNWKQKSKYPGLGKFNAGNGFSTNGKIYYGSGLSSNNVYVSDFWEYNPNNDTWTNIGNVPIATNKGFSFVLNGKGYIGGGQMGTSFFEFNPTTYNWTPLASVPASPSGNINFSINNFGYTSTYSSPTTGALYKYDPNINIWTLVNNLPNYAAGISGSYFSFQNSTNGYYGTGINSTTAPVTTSFIYEFNPTNNSWTQKQNLPGNHSSAGSFSFPNNSYVLSGIQYYAPHSIAINSTWQYKPGCLSSTNSTINQSACAAYTLNGQTYTQSGTYTQTLTNSAGCDSIITLNLNISNPPSNQVNLSGNTLTATQGGASYQWLDCNNNLSPIAGANTQSYQPTSSGSYAVSITNGTCSVTSSCTNLTIVGINNQNLESIKIYPNPVKDILTLEVDPSYLGMNYRIVDVLGREVINGNINEQINQIRLQDLVPGIYILFGEKESIKYKIVKE